MTVRSLFFAILILSLTGSCSMNSGSNSNDNSLLSLVQSSDSSLKRDSIRKIKTLVNTFLKSNTDGGANAEMMYEFGMLLDRNRSFSESTGLFKNVVSKYSDSDWANKALYMLINTYKVKVKSPDASSILSKLLLERDSNHPKKEELEGNILGDFVNINTSLIKLKNNSLEKDGESFKVNRTKAEQYIFLSQLYSTLNPNGEGAKENLNKASEFARSIMKNDELIDIFNLLIKNYPDSKEAQEALFLKAFHLENVINDKETAKTLYAEFLTKYPENDFAKDAEFLLKNIDKTEEEILREFEEKLKNK